MRSIPLVICSLQLLHIVMNRIFKILDCGFSVMAKKGKNLGYQKVIGQSGCTLESFPDRQGSYFNSL